MPEEERKGTRWHFDQLKSVQDRIRTENEPLLEQLYLRMQELMMGIRAELEEAPPSESSKRRLLDLARTMSQLLETQFGGIQRLEDDFDLLLKVYEKLLDRYERIGGDERLAELSDGDVDDSHEDD